jgi:aminopeptidase N
LRGWLDGQDIPQGFTLDPDRRWALIEQLSRLSHRDSDSLIKAERQRDPSRRGQTAAIRAEAIRPDPKVKKAWFEKVSGEGMGFEEQRAALRAMFPPEQLVLRRELAGDFLMRLPELAKSRPNQFLGEYAANLPPLSCDEDGAARVRGFLAENAGLPPIASKRLRQLLQEDERCAKLRALER